MILNTHKKLFWIGLIVTTLTIASFGQAYALRIIPQRLVIKPDISVEYMLVKNNSDKVESYRFGWKHMAMDKQGNVLNLDRIGMENAPEGYMSADKVVRFSPRRTTLQPGETQRVTFMVKRSGNMKHGEYRSHFLFERLPKTQEPKATDSNTPNNSEDAQQKVQIDVLVSRAVPIYVLHGETNAKLNFISASVGKNPNKQNAKQTNHLAKFKVQKSGNRSVIGVATILCNSDGKEIVISKPSKIFAVYAEGEYRDEQLAVQMPPNGCSSYRLVVKGHSDDVLAGETLIDQAF